MEDEVRLLGGKAPQVTERTATAMEPLSYHRGPPLAGSFRGDRLRSIDETESMQETSYDLVEPPPPVKPRSLIPGPPSASSMLRRLTTKYAPISRPHFRSTKKTRGREYATLDDAETDQPTMVDLSTIAGLGWEMTDMSDPDAVDLKDNDTRYVPPTPSSRKPDFRSFVHKRHSVGEGMRDIGVQLRRDPTKVVRKPTSDAQNAESTGVQLDRAKTVRKFGQNLAQEKKTIVEIEEVVDLSSLEGGQPDNRASRSFEDMSTRYSVMPQETKSYYFPEDPDIPNWKPFSMSSIYILSLMGIAIVLAGIQEYLCQRSMKRAAANSGLLAFDSVNELSTPDFFAWKCEYIDDSLFVLLY